MGEKNVAYRRKTADQRRQELIDAGIACLGRGGMAGFTIDQICRQAGVSRGLVNHHFRTKEDLLVRIYTDMTDHLVKDLQDGSPSQQLSAIIETSFDEGSFNRSNLRAWLSIWGQVPNNVGLSALHRERYTAYKARIAAAVAELARQSGKPIDSDQAARQLIALIDGLWLEYCLHSESFLLASAKTDCYQFLQNLGLDLAPQV